MVRQPGLISGGGSLVIILIDDLHIPSFHLLDGGGHTDRPQSRCGAGNTRINIESRIGRNNNLNLRRFLGLFWSPPQQNRKAGPGYSPIGYVISLSFLFIDANPLPATSLV